MQTESESRPPEAIALHALTVRNRAERLDARRGGPEVRAEERVRGEGEERARTEKAEKKRARRETRERASEREREKEGGRERDRGLRIVERDHVLGNIPANRDPTSLQWHRAIARPHLRVDREEETHLHRSSRRCHSPCVRVTIAWLRWRG